MGGLSGKEWREEMNKQRKVLITTTYNEMGIIIDTKAEEVEQPNTSNTLQSVECVDAISRQMAINLVNVLYAKCDTGDITDLRDMIVAGLDYLPSAQPERKTAKWVKTEIGWKCSNCTLCTNTKGKNEFNFCPNCGARMEGSENESDRSN